MIHGCTRALLLVAALATTSSARADDDASRRPFDAPRRSIAINASIGNNAPASASLAYGRTIFSGTPGRKLGYFSVTLEGSWELKKRELADDTEAKHILEASGELYWMPERTYDEDTDALVLNTFAAYLHGQAGTPLGGGPTIRSMAGIGLGIGWTSVPCAGAVRTEACARAIAEAEECWEQSSSSDEDAAECQRAKRKVERACEEERAEGDHRDACNHRRLALVDVAPDTFAFGAWVGFVDTHFTQPVLQIDTERSLSSDVSGEEMPSSIVCDESEPALDCPSVNAFEVTYGAFLIGQYTWEDVLGSQLEFSGRLLGVPLLNIVPHSQANVQVAYPLPFLPNLRVTLALSGMQASPTHADHLHATEEARLDATFSYTFALNN